MFDGPMSEVWVMFEALSEQIPQFVTVCGVLLVAAGAIYTTWLAWRKYRTATNRI